MIWSLLLFSIALYLFQWKSKIEFLEIRKDKVKIKAKVIEYRKSEVPIRNDFTKISYPYVELSTSQEHYDLVKLRHTSSWQKPFAVGQEVDVFFYADDLLYWNAYDYGYTKYLPSKWKFWRT